MNGVLPRIGLSLCGRKILLERFTNTCDGSGRDYDSGGADLAPREQWGEETGERACDLLGIP